MAKEPNISRSKARWLLLGAAAASCMFGLIGGAIGGAAGTMWVMETIDRPKFSAIARNAVLVYDMPKAGMRPVDIVGIQQSSVRLNPCLIGFLEEHKDVVGEANWEKVRFHSYAKSEGDIINEVAFARGVYGITRGNDITIRTPSKAEQLEDLNEQLTFHELVHVAQYASGRLDLPTYAGNAAVTYANGEEPDNNDYEIEAWGKAKQLMALWRESDWRAQCHPDVPENRNRRAKSEQPRAKYAIFDSETQRFEVIDIELHRKLGMK